MSKGSLQSNSAQLTEILTQNESLILDQWIKEMSSATRRSDLMKDSDLRSQCSRFLNLLQKGAASGGVDLEADAWRGIRDQLTEVSRTRAQQGFTPTETATFVLSVKRPLFEVLRKRYGSDEDMLASAVWTTTELIDSLGLYTAEMYLKTREEIIRRQQEE